MIKKLIYPIFLLLSFLLLSNQELKATHIMGGEVTWVCNGSGQYVFTYRIYRDCSGNAVNPSTNQFFINNYPALGTNTQLTLDPSQNFGDTIKPTCRGISPFNCGNGNGDPEAVFVSVRVMNPITLAGVPPVEGWVVSYDQGNRNDNSNVTNANNEPITLRAKIFNHSATVAGQCVDNSPNFREDATSLLCLNSSFTYNHNATDDDLDSLTYEWANPLSGFNDAQPYVEGTNPRILSFVNPFSFNNPFPGPESLNLNTGEIAITPNAPGKFVSVVKVTAFKCGEKVAEIFRELQSVISSSCVASNAKPNVRAPFTNSSGNLVFNDTVRAGDLVNFSLQIEDLASFNPPTYFGDTVILEATGQQFGTNYTNAVSGCLNPPCATLSSPLPQKGLLGVNTTFNWQTDCNHVSFTDNCVSGQNTYTFVITASDDACPIPAINIATISITVVGDSVILSPLLNCVDVQTNGDVDLNWTPTPNINSSFTAWLIYTSTNRDGPFTLIDSVLNYNTNTYRHAGAGADQQQRFYHVRSRSGCKGVVTNVARDTVSTIFIEPLTNPTDVTVNWSPLNTPNPSGSAGQYRVFREYPIGTGLSFYQNSASNSIIENFANCEDSVRYRVELVNSGASCVSSSAVQGYRVVFPDPQTNFSFPANPCPGQSINFTNLTTITGGPISYNWDFGDASGSTLPNPSHAYANPGTYTVTLVATSGKGCDSTLTQQIIVTLPDADAGIDQSICPGGSVQIGGTPTTTTAGASISWSPSTGLSGTAVANPTASPAATTTYTVTVTDPAGCTQTDAVTVFVNPFPTADAGSPQTICFGSSVQIGGSPTGPGGATYAWSNPGSLNNSSIANPTANPTATTTYAVTVTSGVNCTATDQVTITVVAEPGADAGVDKTICPGSSVLIGGAPTTSAAGASFAWNNGGSLSATNSANPTATPTATTTYTVTVTATNGCTSTDALTVTIGSTAAADAGADQNICTGGNVQIGGSPTGAVGATFLWDNAASLNNSTAANPIASPASTTTYNVTVTEGGLGCTNTDQVTVFVNPFPTADAGADDLICLGTSKTLGGSPTGPPGATYLWDNTATLNNATVANPVANPTATTTYSVTVTSAAGCSSTDQVTISTESAPNADAGLDAIYCFSNYISSNPTIGGTPTSTTPGVTYAWDNAADLNNASIANPRVVNFPTLGTSKTYTVTVTSANGCTATSSVLFGINPDPVADVSATIPTTICAGETVTLSGVGSQFGSNFSFKWSSNFSANPPEIANLTSLQTTATPLVTTTYTLLIEDLNLPIGTAEPCFASDQITITVNSASTADAGADQVICNAGSVQIGGSPTGPVGSTFSWDNSASLSAANIANPIASPTSTTTYTVTITNTNGCTSTDDVIVSVNPLPLADAGSDQSICDGGTVQIGGSPTGAVGTTFTWNNGGTLSSTTAGNPIANPTTTTTYTVTVTDANGCTSTDDVIVNVGILPTADAGVDQTICEGNTANIGGSPTGPAGSTYQWDNIGSLNNPNAANPIASPTMTTTYSVTVTDASGCSNTDLMVLTVNPIPSVDAGSDQVICDGIPVQIGGSPTSGTAGATFAWNNSASLSNASIANPSANPTTTTTYTVTVTHPNGCTDTDDVLVQVNSNPIADAGSDQVLCLGETATLGGSPTGPLGSSFQWDNTVSLSSGNIANPIATPIVTTTYSVTVTDGNGCSDVDQVLITVNPRPDADAGLDQTICDGSSITIGGSPTSSILGATFLWDNAGTLSASNIANPIASPAITTVYTVTVTHPNACTITDQVQVTVNSSAPADAGLDQTICVGESVSIGGSPTGTAGSSFLWDNAASLSNPTLANPTANPTTTTTYEVTVTDGNGCTGVDQVVVNVNPLPVADAGIDQTICDGLTAVIGGSPTGPVGATFLWDNVATLSASNTANPTASPTSTTTYTVTITNGNGCSDTDQITVTVNTTPSADAGIDQTICNGNPVQIGGLPTSTTVGATFTWDNAGSLSSATIANPIANPSALTTYTVTVTHPNGCTNTDDVTVSVNGTPTVDAGADQIICLGSTVILGGSPTGPVGATFIWDNGGSLSSNSVANPVASPTTTTTYSVTLTDANGCTGIDQILITVNPFPDVDAGLDQIICDGSSIAIGGAPTSSIVGATFLWDNAGTLSASNVANPIASPTTTTVYTVTVTHPNACTVTDQVQVTVNASAPADAGLDQTICVGESVSVGGSPTGLVGSTFLWDNAATLSNVNIANPIANPIITTTYEVTVTDVNGCTGIDQVIVNVNPLPVADAGIDQTICDGLTAIIGGSPTGPAGATYLWSNAGSLSASNVANPIASPSSTTTYAVTVTDGNGCSDVDQLTITVNTTPTADAGIDQIICNGNPVQIGGLPTSTTAGATFAWDNAATLSNATIANPLANPAAITTYTVTVTHPNGCTNTDDVIVSVNGNPIADAGIDQTICLGTTAVIGGSPTGPAGASFFWDNGGSLSSNSVANPVASPTTTTTYSVTITDANGCTGIDQVLITVNPFPDVDAGSDQTICEGSTASIGGAPTSSIAGASFLWDNAGSLSSATASNPLATPIITTIYTVTVTHPNGCTIVDNTTVFVNPAPLTDAGIDQSICIGNSVNIGGTPTGPAGSTFLWDNGGSLSSNSVSNPIATPITTTTYSVTVTDLNGCTNVDDVLITVNPLPTADAGIDQTICENSTVSIGGLPTGPAGATYNWDNGATLSAVNVANPNATPLSTTTYSVTVTDVNGCTDIDDVTILVNPIPDADAGPDLTICELQTIQIGGTPTSSVTGATYAWDNGGSLSDAFIANPIAGPTVTTTYTVTVTHPNGCSLTDQVIVNVNPIPLVDAGVDQAICFGSTATIGGTPTGPTGATFLWDNPASLSADNIANPIASPAATTTYSVTVTDLLGCTNTDQVIITVNPIPDADAGVDQSICLGQTIAIGGSPTSNTAGAAFLWNNGASLSASNVANPIASPVVTTTYTVTVTHPNGCTEVDDITITVNLLPVVDAGIDQAICIGGSIVIGGAPTGPAGANYSWDNGASLSSTSIANPVATPATTTTYSVTVTDASGCTNVDAILITVNPLPVVDAGVDQIICQGQSATLGGSPTGPVGSAYLWDNSVSLNADDIANPTATPTATTTYSVTVTDINGCSDIDQVTITVNPVPDADAGVDVTICSLASTTIGGSPTSSIAGATFAWNNGASLSATNVANPIASPSLTTIYTVTVTHPNGCTSTDDVTVSVTPLPVADAGADQDLCFGSSTPIGGAPTGPSGTTFLWDNGATLSSTTNSNPTANPTSTTTYTVTVTDPLGCTSTDQVIITVIPIPDADAGADLTICNFQQVTIGGAPTSGIVGATFVWDNTASLSSGTIANPIASPNLTTTYTVTVTHPNGCTNTDDITVTVNPLPLVDAGADRDLCIGGTTLLGGLPTGPAGSVYNWDNAATLSSPTDPNPTATPTVTTKYKVTVTDLNGCNNLDSVLVTVNPLPVVDAGVDTIICEGESIAIGGFPTGPVGSVFTWDNSVTLSSNSVANPIASPTVTTTYSVTVVDVNGCVNTDQMVLTVNTAPDVDAGADATICFTDTIVLGGSPTTSVPNSTYLWDNSSSLDFDTLANPKAFPSSTTTYSVTVTDAFGCSSVDQLVITVNPLPLVDFITDETCFGSLAAFTDQSAITAGALQSWAWDFGDGSGTSILQNPAYQYQNAGTYEVKLIVTSTLGCIDSITKSTVINPLPVADAGSEKQLCFGDSVQLGGNPTGPLGATFSWNPGFDLSDVSSANPMAYPLSTTKYYLSVSDANGCINYDSIDVIVNPLPIVTASDDTVLCVDEPVQLNANGALSYSWTPAQGLNNPLIANPIATTFERVNYVVFGTDANGCIDTDTVNIDVFNVNFAGFDTSICVGDSVLLVPIVQGDTTGIRYAWSPSIGLNATNVESPLASPPIDMKYQLRITNTFGCFDRDSIRVNLYEAPIPSFEVVNSPRCSGSVLELVNNSSFTNTYEWFLNGTFMTSDFQPEFFIDNTIENKVTLVAINDNCTDSLVSLIPAQPLSELLQLKFANIFTPNGDGENDIFDLGFTGEFIGCANYQVFDRWGDKVFDTNIGRYGWDGRDLRGQLCKVGVYFYVVRLGTEEIKGSVYLSRAR